MSSASTVRFARLTAVLLPAFIVLWAANLIWRYEPPANQQTARKWERMLRKNNPRVVIFGNSVTKRGVKPGQLAEELGFKRRQVQMFVSPASGAPHWYAAIKNRVYANGHKPEVVLVVADLTALLSTVPPSDVIHDRMAKQLTNDEPVIARKTYGIESGDMTWHHFRQHRGALREAALDRLRDLTVGALFTAPVAKSKGIAARGRKVAVPAMERVFSDENIDMSLHNRVIPVVEHEDGDGTYPYRPAREGYISDITQLVHDNGGRFVFIRAPLAPGNTDDHTPIDVDREAVAFFNELGAGYADLRSLDLRDRHYSDELHMNAVGARLFTQAVARTLKQMGALEEGELPPAAVPLAPSSEALIGASLPDDLPSKPGSSKQGRWIPPGGTLRLTFDHGWTGGDDSFVVVAVAETFGAEDERPTLRLGAQAVDFVAKTENGPASRLRAELDVAAPEGAFTVDVEVPAGGPLVLLQGLLIGRDQSEMRLIGTRADNHGASFRLLGNLEEQGLPVEPSYPERPPKLSYPKKVRAWKGRTGRFVWQQGATISDTRTEDIPFGGKCSPVRVYEDGVELGPANQSCQAVMRRGWGRSCHANNAVTFSASDGSDPTKNGRRYRLRLAENRRCKRAWWLYPRDRFIVKAPPEIFEDFRDGLAQVEMDVRPFDLADRYWELNLKVRVDGQVRIDQTVPSTAFTDGGMRWRLEPPAAPDTRDVEIEVTSMTDGSYLMVTVLAVSEYLDPEKQVHIPEPRPTDRLSAPTGPAVAFRATRTGPIPQPGATAQPTRTRSKCGYRYHLPQLVQISDTHLRDGGVGRASPLRLAEDGTPLKAHATVKRFRKECGGAYGHVGDNLMFSPTGTVDAVAERVYALTLDPAFPTQRVEEKADVYWIYPGTEAVFAIDEAWDVEARGPLRVLVEGYLAPGTGAPEVEVEVAGLTRTLKLLEGEHPQRTAIFEVEDPPDGPFEVRMRSTPDGAYMALQNLWLGEGERGGVVVALPRTTPR